MLENRDHAVDLLVSRQALHDLNVSYCNATDRVDGDQLRSLFHDDGRVQIGAEAQPIDEYVPATVEYIRTQTVRTFHAISNEIYRISGDTAVGQSYVVATSTNPSPEGSTDGVVGGRYLDEFERRAGVWKFVSRTFVMDWNMTQPATGAYGADGPYAMVALVGGRKPVDEAYRRKLFD